MPIDHFQGGTQSAREKLNGLVDVANQSEALRGDDVYTYVRRGPGYSVVGVNIDRIIERIPKGGGSSLPKGQYQYMVYQMVADNVPGWDFPMAHPTL